MLRKLWSLEPAGGSEGAEDGPGDGSSREEDAGGDLARSAPAATAAPASSVGERSGSEGAAVVLQLTPAAKDVFKAFVNEHAEEAARLDDALAAAWSKLEGCAARLALDHYLLRWALGEPGTSGRVRSAWGRGLLSSKTCHAGGGKAGMRAGPGRTVTQMARISSGRSGVTSMVRANP